jgi:hypothetical protein
MIFISYLRRSRRQLAELQLSRRDLEKKRFLYTKDHNTATAAAQKCIFIKKPLNKS